MSYRIFYGPFDETLFICHHCDNRSCSNPFHLFSGTALDNVTDMIKKGRRVKAIYNVNNTNLDKIKKNNTSGYCGVRQNKGTNTWQARATINHVLVYIGTFDTPEEANEARLKFLAGPG